MENASKALLIAGGMLLAMLTASLLMLLNNNIQSVGNAKSEKIAQEQRNAFNKEYEAYNKKIMYGTDVITVINKAIDNNILMNNLDKLDNLDNLYYVNVTFTVKNTFGGEIVWKYDDYRDNPDNRLFPGRKLTSRTELLLGNDKLVQGEPYTLGGIGSKNGDRFQFNDNIKALFEDEASVQINHYQPGEDPDSDGTPYKGKVTKLTYSSLVQFKKAIFTCTNIIYDNKSGRVREIEFEQVTEMP